MRFVGFPVRKRKSERRGEVVSVIRVTVIPLRVYRRFARWDTFYFEFYTQLCERTVVGVIRTPKW